MTDQMKGMQIQEAATREAEDNVNFPVKTATAAYHDDPISVSRNKAALENSVVEKEVVNGDDKDLFLDSDPDSTLLDDDQGQEDHGIVNGTEKYNGARPNRYIRPDPKPVAVFTAEVDDLSFDKCSASQTYENFIKEAYSKVQRQVEQSRNLIEANIVQEMGGASSTTASYLDYLDEGRPIRTFGRYNDTTHTNCDTTTGLDSGRKSWMRAKLTSEDSTTSDLSESGCCADDASSSSNDERAPRTWENNSLYGNRRYYSRFDQGKDPDYFDFDLNHSVDLFRKPKLAVAPRDPTYFEHQLFNDKSRMHGHSTTISSLMFKGAEESESKAGGCKTALQTSFISSALRTPSYWEYRYQHMN